MKRKQYFIAVLFISSILVFSLRSAGEAQVPCEQVRVVVPYTAGARTDTIARIWSQVAETYIKKQVVVENWPGSGGAFGAISVLQQKQNGCALLATNIDNLILFPKRPKVPYSFRDFAAVGQISTKGTAVIVRNESPLNSIRSLLESSRRTPGKLTYSGSGSIAMLQMDLFLRKNSADIRAVRYVNSQNSIVALKERQVDASIAQITASIREELQSRRIRILVLINETPDPIYPEAPLAKEYGYVNLPLNWVGLAAPKQTPANILSGIRATFRETLRVPTLKSGIEKFGDSFDGQDSDRFEKIWARDNEMVNQANLCAGCTKNNCPSGCDTEICCK